MFIVQLGPKLQSSVQVSAQSRTLYSLCYPPNCSPRSFFSPRNLTETLEEVHRATMMNPRVAEMLAPLVQPGEKLCVLVSDSFPVKVEKPEHHGNQGGSWSTKHHGNSLSRWEMSDLEGRPVFTLPLSASTSPRATDESMGYFILDLEAVAQLQGGLTEILVGLPGYRVVHFFDNGFRYTTFLYKSRDSIMREGVSGMGHF